MLSAQQELGDTGTAHGSDMRDIDYETCKSPTGNVSTNHRRGRRANLGYTSRMLILELGGRLPGGIGNSRIEKSEEVGITQSRRRQLGVEREGRDSKEGVGDLMDSGEHS